MIFEDDQRVYKYIAKVKDMTEHNLLKAGLDIGHKLLKEVQKTNRGKSSHLVGCITLWNGLKDGE